MIIFSLVICVSWDVTTVVPHASHPPGVSEIRALRLVVTLFTMCVFLSSLQSVFLDCIGVHMTH